MKRLVMILAVVLVLVPASLWAQDAPKAEVFGGFSILHISDQGTSLTPLGWQAAVTANLNSRFGIVGDFSGNYKDDPVECPSCKFHAFLGGVQVTHHLEKATVFGHALYGGTRQSVGGSVGGSDTNFTMGYGGGIDVKATDKMSIRVIQFDWLPVRSTDSTGASDWITNVTRYGFGVVFKLGS